MKIKIVEPLFENYNVDISIEHQVIRTIIDDGDLLYVIHDRNGKEFYIIDMCAEEIN